MVFNFGFTTHHDIGLFQTDVGATIGYDRLMDGNGYQLGYLMLSVIRG